MSDNSNKQEKKMVAPIVITVLCVIYYLIYFLLVVNIIPILLLKILLGVIPLVFAGVMIYVCIQRVEEIRSGEEDDLSKY